MTGCEAKTPVVDFLKACSEYDRSDMIMYQICYCCSGLRTLSTVIDVQFASAEQCAQKRSREEHIQSQV